MGLGDRVTWLGWLPRAEALEQYRWADVFAFTSLRDTSGNVVLEALAAGLPVICLDHQGVGDIVTERCGVKIAVTSPRKVVVELAAAIESLAKDKARWKRLSDGASERIGDYVWRGRPSRSPKCTAESWDLIPFHRRVPAESVEGKVPRPFLLDLRQRSPLGKSRSRRH